MRHVGTKKNLIFTFFFFFFLTNWDVTPEPCVHAPLPFEPNTFLAFMRLPLPPGLFDYVTHSGIRLTLVA